MLWVGQHAKQAVYYLPAMEVFTSTINLASPQTAPRDSLRSDGGARERKCRAWVRGCVRVCVRTGVNYETGLISRMTCEPRTSRL